MESIIQRLDIRRQLIALTFPIFIETLLIMLAGFVDVFMLSRVSDSAVARSEERRVGKECLF